MTQPPTRPIHQTRLANGVDLLAESMPGYHTATLLLRVPGGLASEPADQLGLAYVIEQSVDKGTHVRDARALADAFDAIGARFEVTAGRQSWLFVLTALPEFLAPAIALLGECVTQPTFPDDAVETAVDLTLQELASLEDYPRGILRREMSRLAYGPVLGRHSYGTAQTLERITPGSAREHWLNTTRTGNITAAVAGKFEPGVIEEALLKAFAPSDGHTAEPQPRADFAADKVHIHKDFDQTQMGISFPGVPYTSPEFPIERLMLGVLSGGMSSRLFTEVREKLGLVYWVRAWHEQPRQLGMIHLGAATTPARCQQTFDTLMREISRLADDITEDELERARTGIVADAVTTGSSPSRRASDLISDHFHLGHALPLDEKLAAIRAVTTHDVVTYLNSHSREQLSIVTVGKAPL